MTGQSFLCREATKRLETPIGRKVRLMREREEGMVISLDNLDHEDGMVLVTCEDREGAIDDQSIDGARWEAPADMNVAYAYVTDRPSLVADLEREGYRVLTHDYVPMSDDEECPTPEE